MSELILLSIMINIETLPIQLDQLIVISEHSLHWQTYIFLITRISHNATKETGCPYSVSWC